MGRGLLGMGRELMGMGRGLLMWVEGYWWGGGGYTIWPHL